MDVAPTKVRSPGRQIALRSAMGKATGMGRARWIDAAVVVGLSLVAYPLRVRSLTNGLDPSWMAALDLAAKSHAVFGREFVFTYGPLGFATVPTYVFPSTWILAALLQAFVVVALVGLTYQLLRRHTARGVAAIVTAAALLPVLAIADQARWWGS